jgi:alanine racemase
MSPTCRTPNPTAWAEIDLKAVRHNFRELRKLAFEQLEPRINRSVDILSVVKADSYGHGMVDVAKVLEREGGRFFAVSNLSEAIELRESGNRRRIVLFETTFPELARDLVKYDLTPAVCTIELARELDKFAKRAKKKFPVHVKVDTGMGRLGVWHKQAVAFVHDLSAFRNLHIEGIFTHFPVADTDKKFTEQQMEDFSNVVADLIRDQVPFRYLHAANSMGLADYKNRIFNLARPGIMLYGLYPSEDLKRKIGLKAAMSVKARVLFTKTIYQGSGISYGHTFRASQDIPVAVIAIGYSDGYFRALSNKAHVLLNGTPCPVLGRVTMDQTIVDISRAGQVSIGDEAIVIGDQGVCEISADDIAAWAGTINYEVACNLGNRLPRVFIK